MFISSQQGRLSLVRQDDHMAQTATIAANWNRDWFTDSLEREDLVTAMALHDAGWGDPDDRVLFDEESGRPRNFTQVGIRDHAEFYRNGYELALGRRDGAGLLVGMHWIGLYQARFGIEPHLRFRIPDEDRAFADEVIDRNEREWAAIRRRMWSPDLKRALLDDRIWRCYEVFQLIDRVSISVCMSDLSIPKTLSLGEVRFGDAYEEATLEIVGDGTVRVTPFPFDDSFEAPVRRRFIEETRYSDQAAAADAVAAAEDEPIDCLFRP